jgi:hypothetical protein
LGWRRKIIGVHLGAALGAKGLTLANVRTAIGADHLVPPKHCLMPALIPVNTRTQIILRNTPSVNRDL